MHTFSSWLWHVVGKHFIEAHAIANVAKKCAKNSQCSKWNKKGYMGHSYGGNCIKPPQWKQQMCTKIVWFDSARVCSWAQKAFERHVSGFSLPFVFQQNSSICYPATPLENFTCVKYTNHWCSYLFQVFSCTATWTYSDKSGFTRLLFNAFLNVQL